MANVLNKDISHHRSHTELNKHKQAFLLLHFTYIHKLDLNLAWNSKWLFVAWLCRLPGKAVVFIKKRKKKVVVTIEQGTQLYFKDLKPYFVLRTPVSTPTQKPSVALIVISGVYKIIKKKKIRIHGRVVVYTHTPDFITTRGPINTHPTATPTQQLGSCCIDKISPCLHYFIYVDTRCDRQSAAAAAQFRVQILMSVSFLFINVEHFLHWHSSIYILEFITKPPVCFFNQWQPRNCGCSPKECRSFLAMHPVNVGEDEHELVYRGLEQHVHSLPLLKYRWYSFSSPLKLHFIMFHYIRQICRLGRVKVSSFFILFLSAWLLEELRGRCSQGICVKTHWLIIDNCFLIIKSDSNTCCNDYNHLLISAISAILVTVTTINNCQEEYYSFYT